VHCNLTIAEVAAIAGFCDQSHLSRWFRRFMDMTPREFAQGHRNEPGEQTKRTLAPQDASAANVGVSASAAFTHFHRLLVALDHRAIVRRNLRV
jgi:methylphosphotriester-DNA--protein-cysteine methyltransferase